MELRRYGQPIAVLRAGVRCVDRNGCYPPTDSQAEARAFHNKNTITELFWIHSRTEENQQAC